MRPNAAKELPVLQEPASPRAESFRLLAARLQHALKEAPQRAALVTSPTWAEPRHFVAANLALALAEAQVSTCLVDADLRRPQLHELFSLPLAPGLQQALAGTAQEPDCLREGPSTWLSLLPAGATDPVPARLLATQRAEAFFASLAERFATVVVVTAPALEASEAASLAQKLSGTILVAATYRTARQALQRAQRTIAEVGGTVLGAVLVEGRAGPFLWP
jgi:capsular exopolysaccharide synthesis family protein